MTKGVLDLPCTFGPLVLYRLSNMLVVVSTLDPLNHPFFCATPRLVVSHVHSLFLWKLLSLLFLPLRPTIMSHFCFRNRTPAWRQKPSRNLSACFLLRDSWRLGAGGGCVLFLIGDVSGSR